MDAHVRRQQLRPRFLMSEVPPQGRCVTVTPPPPSADPLQGQARPRTLE
jgi:hypothetical protein